MDGHRQKHALTVGTLIVLPAVRHVAAPRATRATSSGEFYILTLSTLLGMYFMIGAGNFLLFFIGLELASVPMACLVAFDKYKRYSAEAGAKYILCAAVLERTDALRHLVPLRNDRDALFRRHGRPHRRFAVAGDGPGLLPLGARLQDFARALPPLDGGRLPGRADERDCLSFGGLEGRCGVRAADGAR